MESFKKTYDKTRLAIEKEADKTRLAIEKEADKTRLALERDIDSMGLNTPTADVFAKKRFDYSFQGKYFEENLTLIRQLYRMKQLDVETYVTALRGGGGGGMYIQEDMSRIISWAEQDDSEEKRDILKVAQESLVLMLRYLANGGR